MAKDITVHFKGNARDLIMAAGEAGLAIDAFEAQTTVAKTSAMGLKDALASIPDAMPSAMPVIVAYATLLGVTLAPALMYTAGLASTLALALGGLGIFGVIAGGFTAMTAKGQGWLTAANDLATANKELASAQEAVERSAKPTKAQLDALADAQKAVAIATEKANNPWTNLINRLERASDSLGAKFLPYATRLLEFLTGLVDPIEQAGSKLIDWFGPRLEPTLKLARQLFDNILAALENLGQRLGPVFDDIIKHPQKYERAFTQALDAVTAVVVGFVNTLTDLADWWTRHPEMQRNAELTFQAIGAAIDVTVRSLERVAEDADWALGNLEKLWNWAHGHGFVRDFLPGGGGGGGGFDFLFAAQGGGVFPAGSMGIVGEAGPELAYALPGGGIAVRPGAGGGGSTYNINVSGSLLASPADIGRQVVAAIQEYERRSSANWRR